jgi:hypothetical protein
MRTDHDLERAVRLWVAQGSDQLPEPALDAALDRIEMTKQRHAGWLARRIHLMNGNALKLGLAAAAIIAVAVLGLRFLPGTVGGPPDSTPTPVPTAETLASGSFAVNLGDGGEAFDIEATSAGEDVSGTFDSSGAAGTYSVDLQCTRTTDDGLLLIAGEVTESTNETVSPGVYVAIMFAPGTPVRALLAFDVLPSDEVPSPADSCPGYLETLVSDPELLASVDAGAPPIVGHLDLGS